MPEATKNNGLKKNSDISTVTIQQGLVVPANREQEAITISRKEFNHLREKVQHIFCKANTFSNIGYTSIGIFSSGLISLIPFIKNKEQSLIIASLIIMGLSLISAISFLILSKKTEHNDLEIQADTIKLMNLIEDRFYDMNL